MSIEKEWEGKYTPVFIPTCDICGATLIPQYYFHDAVESKRMHGWKAKRINGEWVDICDDCLKAERKEEFDCNDCYYSMQNCKDISICCEDETALCDDFKPVAERKEE